VKLYTAALSALAGIWACWNVHTEPGLSRPEHSTFTGPLHCGGQSPGVPQATRTALAKSPPTFCTRTAVSQAIPPIVSLTTGRKATASTVSGCHAVTVVVSGALGWTAGPAASAACASSAWAARARVMQPTHRLMPCQYAAAMGVA
jgi:hypothetical protein